MPTLREYTNKTSAKVAKHKEIEVSAEPEITDRLGKRSVLSADIYDPEKKANAYAGQYLWYPRWRDLRRIRELGYTTSLQILLDPPETGTFQLTVYGFGTTRLLAAQSRAAQILAAIQELDSEYFATMEVRDIEDSRVKIIEFASESVDVATSAGTILSAGGLGRLEITSAFTDTPRVGDKMDIHQVLPTTDADNFQGLHYHVNDALSRIDVIDMFPITPVQNSLGTQTIFSNKAFPWLVSKDQIIAQLGPTLWYFAATLTPPADGTFSITIQTPTGAKTTSMLTVSGLTGQQIYDAINTAAPNIGLNVTPRTSAASFNIFVDQTYYASHKITVSRGTATNSRTMLATPVRTGSFGFSFDAEAPYLTAPGLIEGYSVYVYGHRPANTWIAKQSDFETPTDLWDDSTEGLVGDSDQAVPDLNKVAEFAYYLACEHLASKGPQSETEHWRQRAKRAAINSAFTKLYGHPWDIDNESSLPRSYGGKMGRLFR